MKSVDKLKILVYNKAINKREITKNKLTERLTNLKEGGTVHQSHKSRLVYNIYKLNNRKNQSTIISENRIRLKSYGI